MNNAAQHFHGAKIALLWDSQLLVYQRDDKDTIPFPGQWDLPGGGREGNETPVECVLREVQEEFGLALLPSCVHWTRWYPSWHQEGAGAYFMVGALSRDECAAIRFGDEGQQWGWMDVVEFLSHPHAVTHLQQHFRDYWHDVSPGPGCVP